MAWIAFTTKEIFLYLPKAFEQTDIGALHALIVKNPLATLITTNAEGLTANHIPMEISPQPAPYGSLHGHVARANSLWREVSGDQEVLAIFHGANAYISPSWYPSKQAGGKVVPTWNYAVVHVYGRLRVIEDVATIRSHIVKMTERQESAFPRPWAVADAPAEFTEKLLENVLGIELTIIRLVGKWKLSQNRTQDDRAGVMRGLQATDTPAAWQMVELMKDG